MWCELFTVIFLAFLFCNTDCWIFTDFLFSIPFRKTSSAKRFKLLFISRTSSSVALMVSWTKSKRGPGSRRIFKRLVRKRFFRRIAWFWFQKICALITPSGFCTSEWSSSHHHRQKILPPETFLIVMSTCSGENGKIYTSWTCATLRKKRENL